MKPEFRLYADQHDFCITNCIENFPYLDEVTEDICKLYGYYFSENAVHKNCDLNSSLSEDLKKNLGYTSGIFSAILQKKGTIKLLIDPLIQYSIFYYINGEDVTISNNLLMISAYHNLTEMSDEHLFDQIAYQSPLRGATILKDLYVIQYDDVHIEPTSLGYKSTLPLNVGNFSIEKPRSEQLEWFDYHELCDLYISRLNRRASILADKYREIHVSLTGGADSRLAMSSMLIYDNVYAYCYGNGTNQNRLIYEEIVSALKLKKSLDNPFVGRGLTNSALIIKALVDSNFRKFHPNTYTNSDEFVDEDKCKVTGYYGANISGALGGVGLPPSEPERNKRISFLEPTLFTYHDYISQMKKRHDSYDGSAFMDLFYINNRGPSHYGAHSIADNKKCNSFDILYDPISIYLVRKSPYQAEQISRSAISVDLIYKNHESLALFPYDDRQIPIYRDFLNVPLINCFDGYKFPSKEVEEFTYVRQYVDCKPYDLLDKGDNYSTVSEMMNYREFDEIYERLGISKHIDCDNATKLIMLYYFLSQIVVSKSASILQKGHDKFF